MMPLCILELDSPSRHSLERKQHFHLGVNYSFRVSLFTFCFIVQIIEMMHESLQ